MLGVRSPFNKKIELLCFGLPWIFFLGGVIEYLFRYSYSVTERTFFYVISQIFLLNSVHVAFSFIFMLGAPEFREFFRQKNQESGNKLLIRWSVVFVLFLVFNLAVSLIYYSGLIKGASFLLIVAVFFVLYILYSLYHGAGQSFGISMIYYDYLRVAKGQKIPQSLARAERLLWPHLVGISVLIHVCLFFPTVSRMQVALTTLATLSLHLGWILYNVLRYAPEIFWHRVLFCGRYIFYPLQAINFMAALGLAASHGIEHLMISEKMHRKTKWSFSWAQWPALAYLVVFVISVMLDHYRGFLGFFTGGSPPENRLYIVNFIVYNATSLLHFHVESDMFRFKDPIVRANQGTLILSEEAI